MAAGPNEIYFHYLDNSDFVQETIFRSFETRVYIRFFSSITVIKPLTVSVNATGKKRFILELKVN